MKQENPLTLTLLASIFVMLTLVGGAVMLKQEGGVLGIDAEPTPWPVRPTPTITKVTPTPNVVPSTNVPCFEMNRLYKIYCSSAPSVYPTPKISTFPTITKSPTYIPRSTPTKY